MVSKRTLIVLLALASGAQATLTPAEPPAFYWGTTLAKTPTRTMRLQHWRTTWIDRRIAGQCDMTLWLPNGSSLTQIVDVRFCQQLEQEIPDGR